MCLALIIQILLSKQNFSKKDSRTFILAACYSRMQSYFIIHVILAMLFDA